MIEIEININMLDKARKKAEELGPLKGSILSGAGNLAGFLGEEIVLETLKNFNIEAKQVNTYDHDIKIGEITFDVKTKQTTRAPLPEYEASVAAFNTKQLTDYYIFTRVHMHMTRGWILGFISKDNYFKQAIKYNKGDVDESNKFTFKRACYNLKYNQLLEFSCENLNAIGVAAD